jgi:hypothetical protein|tara:strand:+ start:182 stop:616 length:435 start_codon:yes stop_codon:yes gene_type:complete
VDTATGIRAGATTTTTTTPTAAPIAAVGDVFLDVFLNGVGRVAQVTRAVESAEVRETNKGVVNFVPSQKFQCTSFMGRTASRHNFPHRKTHQHTTTASTFIMALLPFTSADSHFRDHFGRDADDVRVSRPVSRLLRNSNEAASP